MREPITSYRCALIWTLIVLFSATTAWAQGGGPKKNAVDRGLELFRRNWLQVKKVPHEKGDGIGPLFNASSCVACHWQGGVGGGGDHSDNVTLISAVSPRAGSAPRQTHFANQLSKVHPALHPARLSLVLHTHSNDQNYPAWRRKLLGIADVKKLPVQEVEVADVRLQVSQRNTPALFGAAMIDRLEESELQAVLKRQAATHPELSGRLPRTDSGRVGRFGWRGQVASLHEFVLGACANELGLEVAGHGQAMDPLRPDYRAPGIDLSDEECNDITAFIASLPAPRPPRPRDNQHAVLLNNGKRLFKSVGCAGCHQPDVGVARGVYSDLLLHDMGPQLADLSMAHSERGWDWEHAAQLGDRELGPRKVVQAQLEELAREWRTPPLWGVGESAPYLHDGRASTLQEAILAHGGEAAPAVSRYAALPPHMQANIIHFLNSLEGPMLPPELQPPRTFGGHGWGH